LTPILWPLNRIVFNLVVSLNKERFCWLWPALAEEWNRMHTPHRMLIVQSVQARQHELQLQLAGLLEQQ